MMDKQHESIPLSVRQYLGIFALMLVPIANIVLLFVWSFGESQNINKRNLSRALLIFSCICIVTIILLYAIVIYVALQINDAIIRGIPGR